MANEVETRSLRHLHEVKEDSDGYVNEVEKLQTQKETKKAYTYLFALECHAAIP